MRVTVEEIAKTAGVSKATVSRVLNHSLVGVGEATRKKVQDVIDSMHYSNAAGGNAHARKSIALAIPDILNPFFAEIALAVEKRAKQEDYFLIIMMTDFSLEKDLECIRNLVVKKVDGIILISTGLNGRAEHLLPKKYGIPMVMLDRKVTGVDLVHGVYSDNEYACFQACEQLINGKEAEMDLKLYPKLLLRNTTRRK